MLFVCQISSEAYVDRNEPIAIPAGCEQRETQMKTSFPEYELAAPLLRTLSHICSEFLATIRDYCCSSGFVDESKPAASASTPQRPLWQGWRAQQAPS